MTEIDHPTELILGTAQFQSGYGIVRDPEHAHQSDSADILKLVALLGIAALDTAPAYGGAEDVIGQSGCGLPEMCIRDSYDSGPHTIRTAVDRRE